VDLGGVLSVRAVTLTVGIALAYGLVGVVGLWLAAVSGGPSVFWPAAGVAVAAVARFGWRAAPGLVAGVFAVKLGTGYAFPVVIVVTVASLTGAALGGWLIRRNARDRLPLNRITDVGVLAVAAVIGSAPAAVVGPLALWAGGLLTGDVWRAAVIWWLGDAAGVLLLAPILLGPAKRRRAEPPRQPRVEAVVVWGGLAVSAAVAAGFTLAPGVLRFPATTACLPLLAIAAVRFGPRGAALANLVTAAVVVGIVAFGGKPEFNLVLVAFLGVSSVTALSLGAVTAERDAALARLAADIDARVAAESARVTAEVNKTVAEAALAADRALFAALLEHSQDAIVVVDADGRTAFASDAVTRLTGRTPAELVGASAFEYVHPDDLALARLAFADCLAHPTLATRAEFRVRTADGRWVWLEALGTNHLGNPAVAGVVLNVRDVTERRETDNRLRKARELLESTGRLARIGGWEYVIPEDRLVWSEQTYRIHGVTPVAYTPTVADAIDFYAPEARPVIRAAVERGMTTGEPWNLTLPFVTDAGRPLWVNAIGQVEFRDGRPYRLFGTFQDVTERVESERAVERSESRYQNLFESAPVAIWEEDLTAVAEWFAGLRASGVTDLAAHFAAHPTLAAAVMRMIRVCDVNRAAVVMNRAADKAELLTGWHRLFTTETLAAFATELVALWNGQRTLMLETRAARLNGEPIDVVLHMRVPEVAGQPDFTRVVLIALDVTDQKRLEDQFRQSQKLEAVGRLAGGIAHDFNNLLTVINGFTELLLAEAEAGPTVRDLAGHIRDAGGRAADLTRQLLAFSRKQPPTACPVDLAAVVTGLRPLLTSLVGDEVRLVTRLAPVPPVLADKGQLESVVMNLAVNARDAMPKGGTLTVETRLTETGRGGDLPPGRWVVLSVADTGTGIPAEVRPHLFEPFFTTKEVGKGTGLGLPTVYGIVTTAGGHVRYDTAPDCGTTFRVYLPAASDERGQRTEDRGQKSEEEPNLSSVLCPLSSDCPRVLLVEDQPAVRALAAQILAGEGFAVTEAEDGPDALAKLSALPSPPDVLVTDLQMPRMNGRELADRVRALRPGVRVLFVSGFAPEEILPASTGANEAFLPKPFGSDELVAAVRGLVRK
jgi:PAS domain S-box-containing protein